MPSISSHHSSRVLALKIVGEPLLHGVGHWVRSCWYGQLLALEAGEAEQLGVELRLDRADRHVLAVGGLVDVVEVGAGVEHVGAPLVLPDAHGPEGVEHRHEDGGAVDHGRVDHLALAACAARSSSAAHDAEGEQHAAAAEVADQVERRHGRPRPGGRSARARRPSAM